MNLIKSTWFSCVLLISTVVATVGFTLEDQVPEFKVVKTELGKYYFQFAVVGQSQTLSSDIEAIDIALTSVEFKKIEQKENRFTIWAEAQETPQVLLIRQKFLEKGIELDNRFLVGLNDTLLSEITLNIKKNDQN